MGCGPMHDSVNCYGGSRLSTDSTDLASFLGARVGLV